MNKKNLGKLVKLIVEEVYNCMEESPDINRDGGEFHKLESEFNKWHELFKKHSYGAWDSIIKRGQHEFAKEIVSYILKIPAFVDFAKRHGSNEAGHAADIFARQAASEYARYIQKQNRWFER